MTRRFLLAIVLLLLASQPLFARTWQIAPDGSGDAPTIQAGVDSAAVAGDEVVLADGAYIGDGNRDIELRGKSVTVRSASGDPESCLIDMYEEHYWITRRGFRIHEGEGPETRISGVTIQFGYQPRVGANNRGGGILIQGADPVIENCIIRNSQAENGGGICIEGTAAPSIAGCQIISNYSYYMGGGIHCSSGSMPVIEDCLIDSNETFLSGGGVCVDDADLLARSCVITNNLSGSSGGGVGNWEGASLQIHACRIGGNRAGGSGGVFVHGGSTLSMTQSLIHGNYGNDDGGVGLGPSSFAELEQVTISGNHVWRDGGGLGCNGGTANLSHVLIYGNCSDENPGRREIRFGGFGGDLDITCSAIDSSGIGGSGTIQWIGTNLFEDPLYCDPADCFDAPTTEGDYSLQADSPCLRAPECGSIGALGEGCVSTGVRSGRFEPASWSAVKRMFR